jgi:hypothetical protein
MLFWLFSGESGRTGTRAAREGLISCTSVNSGLQKSEIERKNYSPAQSIRDLSPSVYDLRLQKKIERSHVAYIRRYPSRFSKRRSGRDQMTQAFCVQNFPSRRSREKPFSCYDFPVLHVVNLVQKLIKNVSISGSFEFLMFFSLFSRNGNDDRK